MYYIYLDTKIIGAIQQLIVYFSNQIFPYENTVVIYKKYKKHWQIFNKLFKNAGITAIPFERYSQIQMKEGGIVFYLFNAQSNCRIVSDRGLTHIFVTHGESNKVSSVKPIIRIYDHVTTAGQGGIDRFLMHNTFTPYDIEHKRILTMGDTFTGQTGLSASPQQQNNANYATTWEGGNPSENYSSLANPDLVAGQLIAACNGSHIRHILIKPHPNTGHRLKEYRTQLIRLISILKQQDFAISVFEPYFDISFFKKRHLKKQGIYFTNDLARYYATIAFCDVSAIETQLLNEEIPYSLFCKHDHFDYLKKAGLLAFYHQNLICLDKPNGETHPYLSPELKAYMIDATFEQIPLHARIKNLAELIK